jgi:predicted ATP-dependent serine protease
MPLRPEWKSPPILDPVWPGTPWSFCDFLDDCVRWMDTRQLANVAMGTDLLATEAYWVSLGMDEEKINEAVYAARHWRAMLVGFRGHELVDILEESLIRATDTVERASLDEEGAQTVRFPSGIGDVNERCGGFYGVTTIVADTGLGKSMAAIGSAVECALAGIKVVYVNAELPMRPFSHRVKTRVNSSVSEVPLSERAELMRRNFMPYTARGGLSFEDITRAVLSCITPKDKRVLVVLDSVNTITEMSDGEDYFEMLNRLGLWAMESRRGSEGDIGWILVSETNQRGEVKGGKLGFLSDVVLHLAKTDHEEYVKLVVMKGREGGGGDLGQFYREWQTGHFRAIGEGNVGFTKSSEVD